MACGQVVIMALGGSTNAVLHLIAMARSAGVEVTLDDFQACVPRFHAIIQCLQLMRACVRNPASITA